MDGGGHMLQLVFDGGRMHWVTCLLEHSWHCTCSPCAKGCGVLWVLLLNELVLYSSSSFIGVSSHTLHVAYIDFGLRHLSSNHS